MQIVEPRFNKFLCAISVLMHEMKSKARVLGFCLLILILSCSPLFSQRIAQQGAWVIGGEGFESGTSMQQTHDGGYVMTGHTDSFGAGNSDVYVVKLTGSGHLQWTKTIGGRNHESGNSVCQTRGGGYVITGYTTSFGAGNADIYVVKLGSSGDLEWSRTIGGAGQDIGSSIHQTTDGGFIIGGMSASYSTGNPDAYVVKLDSSGDLEWSKTIGGAADDWCSSIRQTHDGGYVFTGATSSFGAGKSDVYVVKLDASGNLQWEKAIGGTDSDLGKSICQTLDGGYIITGNTKSFGTGYADVYVIRLNASGELLWTKTIGGKDWDSGNSIVQTRDGGFLIGGQTFSFGAGSYDFYVVRLNPAGDLEWTKTIGGSASDSGNSICQTSDGGYAVGGSTKSFGEGYADFFLVKLDADANSCEATNSGGITGSGGTISNTNSVVTSNRGSVSSGGSIGKGGTLNVLCQKR